MQEETVAQLKAGEGEGCDEKKIRPLGCDEPRAADARRLFASYDGGARQIPGFGKVKAEKYGNELSSMLLKDSGKEARTFRWKAGCRGRKRRISCPRGCSRIEGGKIRQSACFRTG